MCDRWSQIAHHLPGRSDNEIKNYWHSYLKKRGNAKMEVEESSISTTPLLDHIKQPSQNLSLPKVLFAEWLSLDQDLPTSDQDINHTSSLGDNSLFDDYGLLHNVDFQIPIDYFPGDFNMYTF